MRAEAYLFGQILGTHSFLHKDGFVKPDEYSEKSGHYFLPGGETGTAATILDSLGVAVKMDGTWIGTEVAPMLKAFYKDKKVDLSALTFTSDDEGVMDYVVIAGLVRSPMGRFAQLFSSGKKWWGTPKESDIAGCRAAAVDPYFGEDSLLAAEICVRLGIPYVTIDCMHDSLLHSQAAVNVVSRECTVKYGDKSPEEILELMTAHTDGLTIITQGAGEMLYGRKGQPIAAWSLSEQRSRAPSARGTPSRRAVSTPCCTAWVMMSWCALQAPAPRWLYHGSPCRFIRRKLMRSWGLLDHNS